MRSKAWIFGWLVVGSLLGTGCYYERPDFDEMYADVVTGMDEDDVVEVLGKPTVIIENEMMYLYDDPDEPVRMRFVLDEERIVIEKYMETKAELAKKAEETKGKYPPLEPMPGEEERTYPGGPLERFEKMQRDW